MDAIRYELIVVGAGSGGIGAALAAARAGVRTCLVERAPEIGGTVVRAGVSSWEPGVGGTGLPFDIYRRMRAIPGAAAVSSIGRHCAWQDPAAAEPRFPGGECRPDPARRYADTLQRCGSRGMAADEAFCRERWHGVVFEPSAYRRVVEGMLAETGCCDTVVGAEPVEVAAPNGRFLSLRFADGRVFAARYAIDGTGEGALSAAAGARRVIGREPRGRWGEPSAPPLPEGGLNGVTLVFRVAPEEGGAAAVSDLPQDVPKECWWGRFPPVQAVRLPGGDIVLNALPLMDGLEFHSTPRAEALAECRRRVAALWNHLGEVFPEFRAYRISWIAPEAGVRESYRVVCDHTLTENDIRAGMRSPHGDVVTLADHALDTHGVSSGPPGCPELAEPYGIPFRSLLPVGLENVLVASHAAGFSAIAASSVRLSRTIMTLGQAAGTAIALARDEGRSLWELDPSALRERLRAAHVQLDWPLDDAALSRLKEA